MFDRNSASADARGWPAATRAWLAPRTRVLLPAALVTLFLSSELLFQPDLFDFWSPADVLLAWLEYLAELGSIAAAMVAAYWFVDAAIDRRPSLRRGRLLWMTAAFHAVAFGGLWAMTVVLSGAALLRPTGMALTQAMHWAFIGTFLVIMDTLWQKARRADSEAAALASGGAALAREERELQLRLLQAQIEPHFLFNTLANVRRLYRLHPDQGTQMMDSLKRYLRAALPSVRRADATLADELALVRSYLELLRMRMAERLVYTIVVDAGLGATPFPPMIVVTLVENAIKHGLEPSEHGGRIDVRAQRLGAILEVSVVGLANVRRQLTGRYGAAARLRLQPQSPGFSATIEVPLAADLVPAALAGT
ncbi:MAG: sensor histidine kinase [Burkholderiaceae bacterium]|nr:sensor histidine kinase [Burkholderiaceae bacterium]